MTLSKSISIALVVIFLMSGCSLSTTRPQSDPKAEFSAQVVNFMKEKGVDSSQMLLIVETASGTLPELSSAIQAYAPSLIGNVSMPALVSPTTAPMAVWFYNVKFGGQQNVEDFFGIVQSLEYYYFGQVGTWLEGIDSQNVNLPSSESGLSEADPKLKVLQESVGGTVQEGYLETLDLQPNFAWNEAMNGSQQTWADNIMTVAGNEPSSWWGASPSETQIDVAFLTEYAWRLNFHFYYCVGPCDLSNADDPNLREMIFQKDFLGVEDVADIVPGLEELRGEGSEILAWCKEYGVENEYWTYLQDDIEDFEIYLKGVKAQRDNANPPQ